MRSTRSRSQFTRHRGAVGLPRTAVWRVRVTCHKSNASCHAREFPALRTPSVTQSINLFNVHQNAQNHYSKNTEATLQSSEPI